MSQIEKVVSVEGKSMILYEGYIYTTEPTTQTKLVLRYQNRDFKGKIYLITNQLTQIKIIH